MFAAAADTLAAQLQDEDLAAGQPVPEDRRAARASPPRSPRPWCARRVSDGVARNPPDDPAEAVASAMWDPAYPAIEVV